MKLKGIIAFICILGWATTAQAQDDSAAESPFSTQDLEIENKIELFPNPTVDYLNVQVLNSNLQKTEFTLHNIIGNEIKIEPEKVGDHKYKINVKELSPGYYLLVVKDPISKFNKTFKFLKR